MVGDLSPRGASFPAYHIIIKRGVFGATVNTTSLDLSHLNRFLGQDRNGFQEVLVVSFAEKSQKEQMSELLKLVSREIGKGLTNSFGSIKSIKTHNFANVLPLHCSDAISNAPRIEIWVR